jgi:hypothetical protein
MLIIVKVIGILFLSFLVMLSSAKHLATPPGLPEGEEKAARAGTSPAPTSPRQQGPSFGGVGEVGWLAMTRKTERPETKISG